MLKLFGCLIWFFILPAFSYSQPISEKEVPGSVLSAFKKLFGDTRVNSWERSSNGFYEAGFRMGRNETSAAFNAEGLLQYTEEETRRRKIPREVRKHATQQYPEHKINETAFVTTPDEKLMYKLEVGNGSDTLNLIYNSNNDYLGVDLFAIINRTD